MRGKPLDQLRQEARGCLRLPRVPAHCRHNGHLFHVLLPDGPTRDALLDHLRAREIGAVFHYVPLHLSPMGRRFGYGPGDLPRTEDLAGRLVRLPCFFGLGAAQQDRVVREVGAFFA